MERIARRDTAAALALFDRLYADGKDLGALLDELCALSRDLLVLKTAPQAGLSMLSGVSSEEEAAGLAALLSTGELIQILSVIQAAAADLPGAERTAWMRSCASSGCASRS